MGGNGREGRNGDGRSDTRGRSHPKLRLGGEDLSLAQWRIGRRTVRDAMRGSEPPLHPVRQMYFCRAVQRGCAVMTMLLLWEWPQTRQRQLSSAETLRLRHCRSAERVTRLSLCALVQSQSQ